MEEIWKEYKTFNHGAISTDIEISNLGNVRGNKWHGRKFNDDILCIARRGRRCIGSQPIYILVYEIFNGKRPKGMSIHHIDGDKLNDRLDNLQLLTNAEHCAIHSTGRHIKRSVETRRKMSESKKR